MKNEKKLITNNGVFASSDDAPTNTFTLAQDILQEELPTKDLNLTKKFKK